MLTSTPSQHFAEQMAETTSSSPTPERAPRRKPRQGYTLLGALLVVMVGWGASGPRAEPASGLLLRTTEGVTALDAQGAALLSAPKGQVSPDGRVVVHSQSLDSRRTRVVASDASTGSSRWSTDVDGEYDVRLVGKGGTTAVVGAPLGDGVSPYSPEGRARTRLVVVTASGSRGFDLDGNFEPEALSLDASSLFVIQYTPALAPESYQVRRLDLASGKVGDVFTPDEELQQEMGGTARTQVASTDGRRLYTLYTLTSGDGSHSQAFIHVLDLDEQWAHCIDLPAAFSGAGESTALALSADGSRLYVADRSGGVVSAVDTESLETTRTERLWRGFWGQVVATTSPTDELLVSAGPRVDVLDAETLRPVRSLAMTEQVTSLQFQADEQLAVALVANIVWVDPTSGAVVQTSALADGPPITGLGTTQGSAVGLPKGIDCAC